MTYTLEPPPEWAHPGPLNTPCPTHGPELCTEHSCAGGWHRACKTCWHPIHIEETPA